MYGKEIAEKPDWLELEEITKTLIEAQPEKKMVEFFGGDVPLAAPERTVFAEDEAFKDLSKLLNRGDVGRDLANELRALVAKYKDWNKHD